MDYSAMPNLNDVQRENLEQEAVSCGWINHIACGRFDYIGLALKWQDINVSTSSFKS